MTSMELLRVPAMVASFACNGRPCQLRAKAGTFYPPVLLPWGWA
jgi:hypothetical protein